MSDLTIRRNRGLSVPQHQTAERTGRSDHITATSRTAGTSRTARSERLERGGAASSNPPAEKADPRLASGVVQAGTRLRESRQALRTGEGVLAEVKDALERMADLARQAQGEGNVDREALQAQLESLRADIQRMTGSASLGQLSLFSEDGPSSVEDIQVLLTALKGEEGAAAEEVPAWLTAALTQGSKSAEQLLAGLGLDGSAGLQDILAALGDPSGDETAAYLASLYLGSAIAGDSSIEAALEGLQRLIDRLAEGQDLDQAIQELTGGKLEGVEALQTQFSGGASEELQAFLLEVLGGDALPGEALLALLGGADLNMLMSLLDTLNLNGMDILLSMGAGMEGDPAAQDALLASLPAGEGMPATVGETAAGETAGAAGGSAFPAVGPDLSGVTFDAATGTLTVSGNAPVVVPGQAVQTLRVTGEGTVILHQARVGQVQLDGPAARLLTAGACQVQTVQLARGTSLTLGGSGLLQLGALEGDAGNAVRIDSGAVAIQTPLAMTVTVTDLVSLLAQGNVVDPEGKPLAPADLFWQTLLPGWSQLTGLTVDGRAVRMAACAGSEHLRLWLDRGERGSPYHSVGFRGRDVQGQSRTYYATLRWYQGSLREEVRYPNPFTVTGGEPGKDWVYEEESQTLWILTDQVTAISGGEGTDAQRNPFCGRLALADDLGACALSLGGVMCHVSQGGACWLGRGNQVTLDLKRGSENRFESGGSYAGIALGEGTHVIIDCTGEAPEEGQEQEAPPGTLTALGGEEGGAGIGRDGGRSRARGCAVEIRGGIITAKGHGGGAGIGGGKHAPLGPVTVLGGSVTASGSGGGAGIGGGLGGPVGRITLQGGEITALATAYAAAIGAGVQGGCAEICITGTARIVKAVGGSPGTDIGACLTGDCGRVEISGNADTGRSQLRRRGGIPLEIGEPETVTLPRFRLSVESLGLDRVSVSTREAAREAGTVVEADRRWVSLVQEAYGEITGRLEGRRLRDTGEAGSLLRDAREAIPQQGMLGVLTRSSTRELRSLFR